MEIHERLLLFRERLGLNKTEMAKKLQKSHVAYGNYESGKDRLNINLLLMLANMGCDLHWLITGESPPQSTIPGIQPGAPPDGNMKQCLDIIQKLVEENRHLQKNIDETRAIKIPKKNGTDNAAGS